MTYQEGREARRNGLPRSANPYPSGGPFHKLWDEGWVDSDTMIRALEPHTGG